MVYSILDWCIEMCDGQFFCVYNLLRPAIGLPVPLLPLLYLVWLLSLNWVTHIVRQGTVDCHVIRRLASEATYVE